MKTYFGSNREILCFLKEKTYFGNTLWTADSILEKGRGSFADRLAKGTEDYQPLDLIRRAEIRRDGGRGRSGHRNSDGLRQLPWPAL